MTHLKSFLCLFITLILLSGCSQNNSYDDLKQLIASYNTNVNKPIKPLPKFQPYLTFTYKASGLRNPFQAIVLDEEGNNILSNNIKPIEGRKREYLEQFRIESMSLAGTISDKNGLWALIRNTNGIYRVTIGNYLGKNHGQIKHIKEKELKIIEIIPIRKNMWIERPRLLKVK